MFCGGGALFIAIVFLWPTHKFAHFCSTKNQRIVLCGVVYGIYMSQMVSMVMLSDITKLTIEKKIAPSNEKKSGKKEMYSYGSSKAIECVRCGICA